MPAKENKWQKPLILRILCKIHHLNSKLPMENSGESKTTVINMCVQFLQHIGITTIFRKIESGSFLPGLLIENGQLVIDEEALLHPGDILHEAGHIAVVPASSRPTLDHDAILNSHNREAEEMMAIAWSYAACLQINLDPLIVFHDAGYRGGGHSIVENFNAGHYFGTPMLQWCNMTVEARYARANETPYPHMKNWLRQ
jgi:hypothetical protein